ncbi:MAG: hypothetical protein ACTSYB_09440 [Candidatus Helarchaeota archaeon]
MKMPHILRLLFKFEAEYTGSPLFISGNALRHALSRQVNTSVGIFTKEASLKMPHSYSDFFSIRTTKCFLRPFYERWWNKVRHRVAVRCFFTPRFVTFDLITHLDDIPDIIEHIQNCELIQLGGHRNWGFGIVALQDYLEIDLSSLKFPEKASHLTLLSPMLFFPSFIERYNCRHKLVKIWNHNHVNPVNIIAPGQFFRIKPGKNIQQIALRGILRKTLFGQFGFGEFVVHDWTSNKNGEGNGIQS